MGLAMTSEQESKCAMIIHSAAAAAAAGNFLPLPGAGVAVDVIAMTGMTMSLAGIFGSNLPRSVAEGMAVTAIKEVALKQPIRMAAKELSKLIPGLGQIVAPSMSVAMLEAAGWSIAKQLDREASR